MMDWIQRLAEHPVWLAALLLLAAAVVYGLVKRLFKLALGLLVLLAAVALWFHFTGVEVPDDLKRLAEPAGKAVKAAAEKGAEIGREAAKKVGEKLEDMGKD